MTIPVRSLKSLGESTSNECTSFISRPACGLQSTQIMSRRVGTHRDPVAITSPRIRPGGFRHRLASVRGRIKRGEFLRERQPWPTSALNEHAIIRYRDLHGLPDGE